MHPTADTTDFMFGIGSGRRVMPGVSPLRLLSAQANKADAGMKAMGMQITSVHLIYLRPRGMLISKRHYSDWREIQDEYECYMSSLGPFSEDELVDFLSGEYGADDAGWGFSRAEVRAFMESEAEVLAAREGKR
jgi:hypothetical protein